MFVFSNKLNKMIWFYRWDSRDLWRGQNFGIELSSIFFHQS